MAHDTLIESIHSLYPKRIDDREAKEAASNLLAFVELLIDIDQEHGISCAQNEVQP